MKATTQKDQRISIAAVENLLARPPVERTLRRETSALSHLFIVILASLLLFPSLLIFSLPVSAASSSAAHTMTNAAVHQALSAKAWYCGFGVVSLASKKCRDESSQAPECLFVGAILNLLDPRCRQGATGDNNPWKFPCSDKDDKGTVDGSLISKDWLSGDPLPASSSGDAPQGGGNPNQDVPGHFFVTYANETYNQPTMQKLFPIMQGAGFALLTPVIMLIGYQILWSSWTFNYARILGFFPQFLLSIVAIVLSPLLVKMLIDLECMINTGILGLHTEFPFPAITLNGDQVPLTLNGDSSASLRAIIMPLSRWGCQANRFVGILANKFLSDIVGAAVPFIGGLVQIAGNLVDIVDVVKMLGDLLLCVMSISLFSQVFFRILLLNYYILISPMTFACWALPAGVGQGVVSQWFRGFFSLLFVQTFQVFVIVTLPLILPALPNVPWDGTHILRVVILQLPAVIILMAVNKVPRLMGTKATAAMAQAGSVTSGAVVALASAAWQAV